MVGLYLAPRGINCAYVEIFRTLIQTYTYTNALPNWSQIKRPFRAAPAAVCTQKKRSSSLEIVSTYSTKREKKNWNCKTKRWTTQLIFPKQWQNHKIDRSLLVPFRINLITEFPRNLSQLGASDLALQGTRSLAS